MQAIIRLDELPQEATPEETLTGEPGAELPREALAPDQEDTIPANLAPLEEEVLEGEVTAIIEPTPKPTPKQPPYYLIVVVTIVGCCIFTLASFLLPLLTPSATVTLISTEQRITTTAAIQVPGRALLPLTLMQSTTTLATGHRHQDATQAHGTITFYNGLFTSQTIATGTIFTASNGAQIVTTQPAIIPAGNPPSYGQVTVLAHAVIPGAQGNIQAFDINIACCATSVLAKNTEAFHGGAAARDYIVVTKADIDQAAGTLQSTLDKSKQAALQAQLAPGEELVSPPCSHKIRSDHQPEDEAKQVTVTVSNTCSGIAYVASTLHQKATQMIPRDFRTGYSLIGDLHVSVLHATITDHTKGIVTIAIQVDATYVYQLSQAQKQHIINLIAGKPKQQALTTLLQLPGIQGATFTVKGNAATLPDDPTRITIVVVYRD